MDIINLMRLAAAKFALLIIKENPKKTFSTTDDVLIDEELKKKYFPKFSKYLIEFVASYCIMDSIRWESERIIWIGFHKNAQNSKCLIAQLPKDVVTHILDFLHFEYK